MSNLASAAAGAVEGAATATRRLGDGAKASAATVHAPRAAHGNPLCATHAAAKGTAAHPAAAVDAATGGVGMAGVVEVTVGRGARGAWVTVRGVVGGLKYCQGRLVASQQVLVNDAVCKRESRCEIHIQTQRKYNIS